MSELRQDLISGDWVIIAPGRAARPRFLEEKRPARKPSPKNKCPFEHPDKTGNWPPIIAYPDEKNWRLLVLPNKFPALEAHGKVCSVLSHEGIYRVRAGVGEHRLIITRDHSKNFSEIDEFAAMEVFELFRELCEGARKDPCTIYASPFFNWGPTAGASIWHPHYQFLSLPVIPPHSAKSVDGARQYYKKNHSCAHCDMIRFEKKEKKRIVFENDHALAFIPFASKSPFEVRIVPKSHSSYFYKSSVAERHAVTLALRAVMRSIKKVMNDPDMNMFIHEAPLDGKNHNYHHWHAELVPRVSIPAGFELSTGIYINVVEPVKAAAMLRKR